jgi:predicted nucleic acid-binding protein
MILDSSAIVHVLMTMKGEALQHLEGRGTLDLARYEIGNVIWKEAVLYGNVQLSEALVMAEYAARILLQMNILKVETAEQASETMRLAIEQGLTYYDAAYVYHARSTPPLVTEDVQLLKKAKQADVEAVTVSQVMEAET